MDSASLQTWTSVEHLKMMVLQIIHVSIKTSLPGILFLPGIHEIVFLMENVLFSLIFFLLQWIYNTVLVPNVQKNDSVLYLYIFQIIFHYKLLQDIEYSSLSLHWRNVNWCSPYGKQYGSSFKKKKKSRNRVAI